MDQVEDEAAVGALYPRAGAGHERRVGRWSPEATDEQGGDGAEGAEVRGQRGQENLVGWEEMQKTVGEEDKGRRRGRRESEARGKVTLRPRDPMQTGREFGQTREGRGARRGRRENHRAVGEGRRE